MSSADREPAGEIDVSVGDAQNVLLLAPSMADHDEAACVDLLTGRPPEATDLLYVTLVQSPDDRFDAYRRRSAGAEPRRVGFIEVGGSTRSSAAQPAGTDGPRSGPRVATVSSPGDLTNLGIEINRFLSAWADDGDPAVCLHSLSTLLQYADLRRVFRFLHVLTGRISTVGGVAHYHMDPTAHETKPVNTLLTLFDAVARLDDGDWAIRSRTG